MVNNHMVMLEVHIGKNLVDVAMLDGGSNVNVITKKVKTSLRVIASQIDTLSC
jgi:hypothetical protein